MPNNLRTVIVSLVCIAAPVCAQDNKGEKPKAEPKAEAAKDDAFTAKDPAVVELDKLVAKVDKKKADWRTTLSAPAKQTFDSKRDYFWHVETNKGEIVIKLFPESAPMHVTSTVFLTRLGYYDGLKFHRVIQRFMAQGGCPLGTGTGGPGYTMEGEFDGKHKHDKPGVLSTANTGAPKTDGSQFFLTFVPTPHLDGKHTVVGEVTGGMDALKALEAAGSKGEGAPTEKLMIQRATIVVAEKAKADQPKAEPPKGPGK
jgi:cyclophilin family peptidyl-prolyl cis-trans isomerase